ncbi:hypothetical protein BHM03_00029770 [Ensete ventricosum]|nr:hypothetical protein BHM03_00029770 [Ensete ventricosum]
MAVRIRLQLALDHSLPVAIFPIWSLFKAIIAAPYSSDRSSWRSTCEWWVKVYGQFKELSSVQSTRGRGHIRLLVHAYLCGGTDLLENRATATMGMDPDLAFPGGEDSFEFVFNSSNFSGRVLQIEIMAGPATSNGGTTAQRRKVRGNPLLARL